MVCSAIISKSYCLSQCVIMNFRIYLQRWNSIAKNQAEIGFSIIFWNGELVLWMKWWIRALLRSTVGNFVSGQIQRKIHCNVRLRKKKNSHGETYTCDKGWILWAQAENFSWKDQLSGVIWKNYLRWFCSTVLDLDFNNSILSAKEQNRFSGGFLLSNLVK